MNILLSILVILGIAVLCVWLVQSVPNNTTTVKSGLIVSILVIALFLILVYTGALNIRGIR